MKNIKLKESELIKVIKKILKETSMSSNPIDGASLISVFKDGDTAKMKLKLTNSTIITLDKCVEGMRDACCEIPMTLPDGMHTPERNGCRNCKFYVYYKRQKFMCAWKTPCKLI